MTTGTSKRSAGAGGIHWAVTAGLVRVAVTANGVAAMTPATARTPILRPVWEWGSSARRTPWYWSPNSPSRRPKGSDQGESYRHGRSIRSTLRTGPGGLLSHHSTSRHLRNMIPM